MNQYKYFSILGLFFLPYLGFGQKAPTTTFASKNRLENQVLLTGSSPKSFFFEIATSTHDPKRTNVGIKVDAYSHERFLKFLNAVAEKYENWIQVAKENSITSYYKKLDFTEVSGGYYYVGDDWHIDDDVQYEASFTIREVGGTIYYEMTIQSIGEKLFDADENFFARCDDVYVTFANPKELRKIINFMDFETNEDAKKFLNRPKKDDLFK